MVPLLFAAPVIGPALNTFASGRFVRFAAKRATNLFISSKIGEFRDIAHKKLEEWWKVYFQNIVITIALNVLIIATAFFRYFFLAETSKSIICIIAALSLIMISRTVVSFIRTVIKIIQNWDNVVHYASVVYRNIKIFHLNVNSIIRETISDVFNEMYMKYTNDFIRGVHKTFSIFGMVKSSDEIGEEVVDEFYSLVVSFAVKNIIYKIAAYVFFIGVFSFILKPYIFDYALKMNIFEITFYPVVVAVPKIIALLSGGN